MRSFLNTVRCNEKEVSFRRQVLDTVAVLFMGIALGAFSKFLDNTAVNELPFSFEYLDVRNFFGRFAVWILLGICISVYSSSSIRASINVFAFFAGMITSYYMFSYYVAGFYPKSYALIWIGFTIFSPFLAFICWYAKGKSKISLTLSAIMMAVLFHTTFVYGWAYLEPRSLLELICFVCGVVVLNVKA